MNTGGFTTHKQAFQVGLGGKHLVSTLKQVSGLLHETLPTWWELASAWRCWRWTWPPIIPSPGRGSRVAALLLSAVPSGQDLVREREKGERERVAQDTWLKRERGIKCRIPYAQGWGGGTPILKQVALLAHKRHDCGGIVGLVHLACWCFGTALPCPVSLQSCVRLVLQVCLLSLPCL